MHVTTTLNRGGCENHLAELLIHQKAAGHDVAIAYLKGDGFWTKHMQDAGIRVVPLGLRYYGDVAPLWKLRKLIKEVRPDILHVHLQPAELYSALALIGIWNKPAFVITKHNDDPFHHGPGNRLVGSLIARQADRIIAVSEAVKSYTCGQYNYPASNVVTIHHGIDRRPFEQVDALTRQAIRSEWSVPENAILIGTAARLHEQKALHVFLGAYAQYRQAAKIPSRLALLGSGPLEQDLKKLAQQLNIAHEVVWPGFRNDMQAVMNAFDVFALTSVREGFGLSILEAMSASKPVIATAVGGITEIVIHEKTGLLCHVNSTEDVANAMLRLESASLRAQLGAAGHERVKSEFTIDSMVAGTFEVYQTVMRTPE